MRRVQLAGLLSAGVHDSHKFGDLDRLHILSTNEQSEMKTFAISSILLAAIATSPFVRGTEGRSLRRRLQDEEPKVVSVVADHPLLQTFEEGAVATDLTKVLDRRGPFTVFAPTNDAFVEADSDGLITKYFTPEWKAHLRFLLNFHVASGTLMAESIVDDLVIQTLIPIQENITASVSDSISFGGASFADSKIVEADMEAANGVVHVVDKLFMPTALTMNLFETATSFGGSVATLIATAGLEDVLRQEIVTIFAPSDRAVDAIGNVFLAKVGNDPELANEIFSNHVVRGIWHKDLLTDGLELTTLSGNTLTIVVEGVRFPTYKVAQGTDVAFIDFFNVVASNGITHVIDSFFLPSTGK